jgi:nitrogen PTS system EIIA component
MKILEVLNKDAIIVDLKAKDKKSVLDELVAPVARLSGVNHEDLLRVLMERERLGSTGIGGGIGIPHGKCKQLSSLILGIGISKRGVAFDTMDRRPAHIFFLLLAPENSAGLHLKLLAHVSRLLKSEEFKSTLMQAETPEEIFEAIREKDEVF